MPLTVLLPHERADDHFFHEQASTAPSPDLNSCPQGASGSSYFFPHSLSFSWRLLLNTASCSAFRLSKKNPYSLSSGPSHQAVDKTQ